MRSEDKASGVGFGIGFERVSDDVPENSVGAFGLSFDADQPSLIVQASSHAVNELSCWCVGIESGAVQPERDGIDGFPRQ